jgi:hypothetical protein
VFADNIGHARQLVVAPNGVVYVNTWSGRYYGNDTPPAGGFLVALQDTTGNGRADVVRRFGATFAQGNHGGTGIDIYNGGLFAETNDRIVARDKRNTNGELASDFVAAATAASHATLDLCFARPICRRTRAAIKDALRLRPSLTAAARAGARNERRGAGE